MQFHLKLKIILFGFFAGIFLNTFTSMGWASTQDDESHSHTHTSAKATNAANSSNNPTNEMEQLREKMQDVTIEEKTKIRSFHLVRYAVDRSVSPLRPSLLAYYTEQLKVEDQIFTLKRTQTQKEIENVCNASDKSGGKTFLFAQGICMSTNEIRPQPFTVSCNFLDILTLPTQKMVWVSEGTTRTDNISYHIRNPQGHYGGHAEPQFISDIQSAFTNSSDAIVKYFMPDYSDTGNVYMCGLELFAPYDMCDVFNGHGNNKYDCVGQLLKFRETHQFGQTSISQAIRDKLKNRFKGKDEDAFVVIYHAKYPYINVDSYQAQENNWIYPLNFKLNGCQFTSDDIKKEIKNNCQLSQHKSIDTKPDVLYGYIHQLADKTPNYSLDRFSFE